MSQQTNKKQSKQKEALGKGIRSLLQSMDSELKKPAASLGNTVGIERIPVKNISINPMQPRQDFDEEALQELADSIRLHDVIQPITVSKIGDKYQLISGERRLRASRIAGLSDIPAYIRQAKEDTLLELALLENLQREDLNAIEVALSMDRLIEEYSLTQDELAKRVSKKRSTVANYLRLLKLPPDIQVAVRGGLISMGHAKALIGIEEVDKQLFVFKEIITRKLSVRQTEKLASEVSSLHKRPKKESKALPPVYRKAQDDLSSHFSTRAAIKRSNKGAGKIVLEFYSDEELNHLIDLILK